MQSKFKATVYLVLGLAVFVTVYLCFLVAEYILPPYEISSLLMLVVVVFSVLVWLWLVAGELRTKAIMVTINQQTISSKSFMGLGATQTFQLNELDGFITCQLNSESGSFEYLYLLKNDKKVVKLSEYYHKNYPDLKQTLRKKVRYLGNKPFSLVQEFREVFL